MPSSPFSRINEQAKACVFIVLLSAPQVIIYFELAGARAVAMALSLTKAPIAPVLFRSNSIRRTNHATESRHRH